MARSDDQASRCRTEATGSRGAGWNDVPVGWAIEDQSGLGDLREGDAEQVGGLFLEDQVQRGVRADEPTGASRQHEAPGGRQDRPPERGLQHRRLPVDASFDARDYMNRHLGEVPGEVQARVDDPLLDAPAFLIVALVHAGRGERGCGVEIPGPAVELGQTGADAGVGDGHEVPGLGVGACGGLERDLDALVDHGEVDAAVEVQAAAHGAGGTEHLVDGQRCRARIVGHEATSPAARANERSSRSGSTPVGW